MAKKKIVVEDAFETRVEEVVEPEHPATVWFQDRNGHYQELPSDTPFRGAKGSYHPLWAAEPYNDLEVHLGGSWFKGMVVGPPVVHRVELVIWVKSGFSLEETIQDLKQQIKTGTVSPLVRYEVRSLTNKSTQNLFEMMKT